ncbi:MAG: nucleoid-associated protein [bacterium]
MESFKLNHLTLNFINKDQNSNNISVTRGGKIFRDDISNSFAKKITETYFKKSNIERSNFNQLGGTKEPFQQLLETYLDSKKTDDDFLEFTKNALDILKLKMEKASQSLGGHIVFADVQMTHNFIFIAILNEKTAYLAENIKKLEPTKILDIDKLAMASFINIGYFKTATKENKHYISFLYGLRKIANYFVDFLGADQEKISTTMQTSELVKAIKQFINENFEEATREEKMQNIYDLLYNYNYKETGLLLSFLSSNIYPEQPDKFLNFAQNEENKFDIDSVIDNVNKSKIKQLVKFQYKGKDLDFSFNRDKYTGKIHLINDNKDIELIDPPKELIIQLKEEGVVI